MSEILIKGMEMPKYCYMCPIHNPENGSCQLGVETYGLEVPKHCHLVEVKPHGRLIDADAFKTYLVEACLKHITHPNYAEAKQLTEDFCKDIDEQPTIMEASCGFTD